MRKIPGLVWRRLRRLGLAPGAAPIILLYHQIADPPCDPWGICVTPGNFRDQLEFLVSQRTVMSMDDLAASLDARDVPPRATAITFDDGYADNALIAKPLLDSLGIPATFFLTTGMMGRELGYWWDELADLILTGREVAGAELAVGRFRLQAGALAQSGTPSSLRSWRVDETPPQNARQSAYLSLWHELNRMSPAHREAAMHRLRRHFDRSENPPAGSRGGKPMDWDMARALVTHGGTVGGHARSHMPLDLMAPEQQHDEISGSRQDIADALGIVPTGFAYPHGRHDHSARKQVREAGYAWAVSSKNQVIHPRFFDRYRMPRFTVGNWTGPQLRDELARSGA